MQGGERIPQPRAVLHARFALVLLELDEAGAHRGAVGRRDPDHEAEQCLPARELAQELVQLVHQNQRLDTLCEHYHNGQRQGEDHRYKKLV